MALLAFASLFTQAELSEARQAVATATGDADAVRSAWQCRICLAKEVDTAYTACGHLLCHQCTSSVGGRCPFCRKISQAVRVFK